MSAPSRCIIAAGLGVLALAGALSPSVASAAPSPSPAPSSSASYQRDPGNFSLTVSPTRLTIGQGDIGSTQQVTLINRGQAALDITVQKRNFTVGSDGALRYQDDAPYAASSWVTVSPKQVVLEPGKAQVVTATVTAPKTYEPGDHQMALVFMVPAGKGDGNVRVNRSTSPRPVSWSTRSPSAGWPHGGSPRADRCPSPRRSPTPGPSTTTSASPPR
jgi:hypothetical protein